MKFYDASKPLQLETDNSSISLGTSFLQVRHGMDSGRDEVLDNTALHPIDFVCKIYAVWSSGIAT